MKKRSGAVLLEVITTAALLGLLCTLAATLLHSESVVVRNTSDHIAIDDALGSAQAIVAAEMRTSAPIDRVAVARDSVAMRVFRGRGIVCARAAAAAHLRYRGLRDANPDKDSLLLVTRETAAAFRFAADAARCVPAADETEVIVATPALLDTGDVVLFFESGTYYLATNALRYRRGLEGKQPLTDEQIDDRASFFALDHVDRGVRLLFKGKSASKIAATADARVRFLNQP